MAIQNYTIPRNNRELQHTGLVLAPCRIIPYQEIIGNYSSGNAALLPAIIIPYQEIIGNYSETAAAVFFATIIPYQEIIGNYSS